MAHTLPISINNRMFVYVASFSKYVSLVSGMETVPAKNK